MEEEDDKPDTAALILVFIPKLAELELEAMVLFRCNVDNDQVGYSNQTCDDLLEVGITREVCFVTEFIGPMELLVHRVR